MKKQRGEGDVFSLIMVAICAAMLGGFFLMLYAGNDQAIECMKVNAGRTAAEVKLLCQ